MSGRAIAAGVAVAVASLLAVAFWPTRERKLSKALDDLLDAIAREDVGDAEARLAERFRFHGRTDLGSGDLGEAVRRLRKLAADTDRLRFAELSKRIDAASGQIAYAARVNGGALGYGPFSARFDVELQFEPADAGFLLVDARFVPSPPR